MIQPRKKTYFLSDTFQSKFLAVSLFHYSIILLTFVGALFAPLMIQLDSLALSHTEKAEFANQFLSLHERLWVPLVGGSPGIQGTSDTGLDQIFWQDSVGQLIEIDRLLKRMNLSDRPGNPSFLKIAHVQRQSQAGERRDNAEDQGELQGREPT